MQKHHQEDLLKHRSQVPAPPGKGYLFPVGLEGGPPKNLRFLKNSQLMMKLLAFSPHFDWPRPLSPGPAGFPELITLAEVDKDGFHHTCCLPSLFLGLLVWAAGWRGYSSGSP